MLSHNLYILRNFCPELSLGGMIHALLPALRGKPVDELSLCIPTWRQIIYSFPIACKPCVLFRAILTSGCAMRARCTNLLAIPRSRYSQSDHSPKESYSAAPTPRKVATVKNYEPTICMSMGGGREREREKKEENR